MELNRGNIPQKQWQEVADAVNSRPCDARRPPRTDIQCKYRVDTLKKKYKIEKNKIAEAGGSSLNSQWQFYDRLDYLIGSSFTQNSFNLNNSNNNNGSKSKNKSVMNMMKQPPMALPLPSNRVKGYPLPPAAIACNVNDSNYDSDSSFSNDANNNVRKRARVSSYAKKEKEDDGIVEMSKAIGKIVDIYEKVEMERGKQMIELEKQRMEFMKTIEIQRMQMIVDTIKMITKRKKSERGKDDDLSSAALGLAVMPNFFS